METSEVTSWEILCSDGHPIFGNTHRSQTEIVGGLICSHGFKGYKDYGFLPMLCKVAAERGLVALRFNFSHSGMTNRIDSFEHSDLFEKDRWSRQVNDLRDVVSCEFDNDGLEGQPYVMFGHSRGGVTSTLAAGRIWGEHFYNRFWPGTYGYRGCAALITAAAPDYACNLDDMAKHQLRTEGRLLSPSGRTGQDLYVGRDWLDEIERDPELYDPVLAAAHVKCPTLIIHGSGDTTVPVECAHNLHRAATPNSRLEIIEGASHTFDCPNPLPLDTPWDAVPAATRKLIDLTVSFAVEQCEKAREVSGGE